MTRAFTPVLACAVTALSVSAAYAQQADNTATGGDRVSSASVDVPGDIVVTAMKRSENLQKVPIAITAISGDRLANQQIRSAAELSALVPNLSVQTPIGSSAPLYSLRGITMFDYSVGQDGPIAVYYDEVYKGNAIISGINFFDLERVEVLKGPQGTLYGKNTTGGAINFISRAPDFTTSGSAMIGYGNYNHVQAEGVFQTPVSSTVALRVAGTYENAKGWVRNVFPGEPDLESTRQFALRGTLLFRPNSDVDVTLRASVSQTRPTQVGFVSAAIGNGIGSPFYPATGVNGEVLKPSFREGLGRRDVDVPNVERRRTNTAAVALTVSAQLSPTLTMTSISSWDKGRMSLPDDPDSVAIDEVFVDFRARETQLSQDLRLSSSFAGPFNFIIGGYYNRQKLRSSSVNAFTRDVDVNGDGFLNDQDCIDGAYFLTCTYKNDFRQSKSSFAAYSDATFKIDERITLRGGLRYTRDTGRQYDLVANVLGLDGNVLFNIVPGNAGKPASLSFKTNNVSGKAGVDFALNDNILLYSSYSRGYRGAAFNAQVLFSPLDLSVAKPEKISALEGGFKAKLLDRRLTVNGAIFDYRYTNQQFIDFDSATFAQRLLNIPRARVRGGELEIAARITDALTLSSGLGYLDGKTVRGTSGGIDISGKRMQNAPKVTASMSVDWVHKLVDEWQLAVHLDGRYSSKIYLDPVNRLTTTQGEYAIFNGKIRVSNDADRFGVSFWMKNITNEFYALSRVEGAGFGYVATLVNPPRQFGVTIDTKF